MSLVSEHPEIQSVVDDLRKRFGSNEDAATNPEILIEAYTELAKACREVGEDSEAELYEKNIAKLKKRAS